MELSAFPRHSLGQNDHRMRDEPKPHSIDRELNIIVTMCSKGRLDCTLTWLRAYGVRRAHSGLHS